jgi:hypothetical protein
LSKGGPNAGDPLKGIFLTASSVEHAVHILSYRDTVAALKIPASFEIAFQP